jgi:hypothetical protein
MNSIKKAETLRALPAESPQLRARQERETKGRIPRQVEFPLAVAVCAWCEPHELGAGLGALSHGICPRHLRELMQQLDAQGAPPR